MAAKKKPRGRPFQKGNPGGPGRPKREVERAYLDATLASVSPSDWQKVVAKALQDAKNGDAAARAWLSKYLLPQDTGDAFKTLLEAL
jgi:hypothetical protein